MENLSTHIMKAIGFFSWPITALASIHIGMTKVGVQIFNISILHNNAPFLYDWAPYVVGVAGALSALSFVMMMCGCFSKEGCSTWGN